MDVSNLQFERSQGLTDQGTTGRPLVDMANPSEANSGQLTAGLGSRDDSSFREQGFINFSDPYKQDSGMGRHQWGENQQGHASCGGHHHGGGDEAASNQQSGGQGNGDSAASNQQSGSQGSGEGQSLNQNLSQLTPQQLEQSLSQTLQSLETEISQLQIEMADLPAQPASASDLSAGVPLASNVATTSDSGSSDTSSLPSSTGNIPSEATAGVPAATVTALDSNAGGTNSQTAPLDSNSGAATVAPTQLDSGAATVAPTQLDSGAGTTTTTVPSDSGAGSTATTSAPSDSGAGATTAAAAPSDSSTFSPSAIAGFSNMTPQEQIAATDPELNNILSDANSQMSQAGAAQFSQIMMQAWMNGQDPDSESIMNDAIGQFQQAGGSSSDLTIANNLQANDITNDDPVYTNTLQMNSALSSMASQYPVVSASGQYSTEGDQIIGPDGKPFIPVGGMTDSTQNYDPSTMIDNGANTVRMFIPHDPSQMPEFEQAVQQVTAAGDVAMLTATVDPDGHFTGQVLTGAELSGYENMWSTLATQYQNNPNVWFDTLNESGKSDANDPNWLAEEQGIIGAIRGTGNNNMIVVDDSNWGQGAVNGASSALTANAQALEQTSDNIVGSLHVYQGGQEQPDETELQSAVNAIQSQGLPVMFGETSDWPANNEQSMLAAIQVGEQDGIGRILMTSANDANGNFVSNFITDASALPDLRSAVIADWQAGQAENAAAQSGS